MADLTVILVIFVIIIVLALIGGIIAIIIVERRRKEGKEDPQLAKETAEEQQGVSKKPISIISASSGLFLTITAEQSADMSGIFVRTPAATLVNPETECFAYEIGHGTFTRADGSTIPNALIWNLKAAIGLNTNETEPILFAAEPTSGTLIIAANPEKQRDLEYSWDYDARNDTKTWCLSSNSNLCIQFTGPTGPNDETNIRLETLPSGTVSNTFQWNIEPPVTVGCLS